eukprot:TRINITY_DN4341_c0_g3_i1.p1 TRINITY_DN4341_c0_g3~~TRINITY_DN4341_c0_g3_i1.p1  ORF type:complete len:403 (-),score=48.05 TRINITY_DN4341_c0_g3_i1:28-1197(-)
MPEPSSWHATWRRRAWRFIENKSSSRYALMYNNLVFLLIACRVILAFLPVDTGLFAYGIQVLLDLLFFLELVVRVGTLPDRSVLFLMNKWYMLIDVSSAIPLVIRGVIFMWPSLVIDVALFELCTSAIALLKILRRLETVHLVSTAFHTTFEVLPVMLYLLMVIACKFALLTYIIEPRTNVATASDAIWMVIVSMFTVGYGDVYPVSSGGRLLMSALFVVSALYMTIPIGIVGNAFCAAWEDRDRVLMLKHIRNRFVGAALSLADLERMFEDVGRDTHLCFDDFVDVLSAIGLPCSSSIAYKLFETVEGSSGGLVSLDTILTFLFPSYRKTSTSTPQAQEADSSEANPECASIGIRSMQMNRILKHRDSKVQQKFAESQPCSRSEQVLL